jgi:hypothetical protein
MSYVGMNHFSSQLSLHPTLNRMSAAAWTSPVVGNASPVRRYVWQLLHQVRHAYYLCCSQSVMQHWWRASPCWQHPQQPQQPAVSPPLAHSHWMRPYVGRLIHAPAAAMCCHEVLHLLSQGTATCRVTKPCCSSITHALYSSTASASAPMVFSSALLCCSAIQSCTV